MTINFKLLLKFGLTRDREDMSSILDAVKFKKPVVCSTPCSSDLAAIVGYDYNSKWLLGNGPMGYQTLGLLG